ncbi:hypothetical protein Sjap_012198 [Stephania japonica]|uniref:Uncharacterized protein n=1 Tax=Stephania japonica TaxID=461633 RepID=A0AAP0IXY9_9MAGN
MEWAVATFQVALENLVKIGTSGAEAINSVNANLNELRSRLPELLEVVLQEDLGNPLQRQDRLRHLEGIVYDGEDLVDEIDIELERRSRSTTTHNYGDQLIYLFHDKLKIPIKVQSILKRIQIHEERGSSAPLPRGPKNLLIKESRIVGRDNSASDIIRKLCPTAADNEGTEITEITEISPTTIQNLRQASISDTANGNDDNVLVIPIVGMAGVGKTALAKLVYDDARINDYFDIKHWFETNKLKENDEEIISWFAALPPNKRILLVLDDLRGCEDQYQQKCDYFVQKLKSSSAGTGTTIIVTTRSQAMVDSKNAHRLNPLSEGDCCDLLTQTVFGITSTTECSKHHMVSLCKQIAEKCDGLPWTAKVLGSMMRIASNPREWTAFRDSNIWDFPEVPRNIPLSFKLSAVLKRCLAYCAIFPRDQDFCKEILVRMWTAEGFIVPEANKRRIEDIGCKYFDELLNMSIFLSEGGKIFKMHTLIHDLAQSISGSKCLRMEKNEDLTGVHQDLAAVRHLSISGSNVEPKTFEKFYKCKGLRTFISLRKSIKAVPDQLFTKLIRLRLLDLSYCHVTVLTDSLGNLIHLRYLNLSNTSIEWLPETITKLHKLSGLNLKKCSHLSKLPKCMGNLINLRHLELEGNRLTSIPAGFGELSNLETLGEFIVGRGAEDARISELRNLENLQGFMRIKKLENVHEKDISKTLLDNKVFLHKLELQWSEILHDDPVLIQVELLKSLQPNENLQDLTIRKYSGREFPNWMGNTFLPCLVSLRLLECQNCNSLPLLGGLPMLKSLELAEMMSVESIDSMFHADDKPSFPSLETLVLMEMPKLRTWKRLGNNDLPSLSKLVIDTCPQLTDLPRLHYLKSLHELELNKCIGLSKLPQEGFPNNLSRLIASECPLQSHRKFWEMTVNIPYREIDGRSS